MSLYELHRKPHEVVTDQTVIGVSPRALHSELMCPICLDLMKNTHTTKEVSDYSTQQMRIYYIIIVTHDIVFINALSVQCLHRFCQECIITALRSG